MPVQAWTGYAARRAFASSLQKTAPGELFLSLGSAAAGVCFDSILLSANIRAVASFA
jgi:hypothetical protein